MKPLFILSIILLFSNLLLANCTATSSGDWETATNWSCGHIPDTGEIAIIPSGISITVKNNNIAQLAGLTLSGNLIFTVGTKLNFSSTAIVQIYNGGTLTGGNPGAKLVFPDIFYPGDFNVTGPYYYTNTSSGVGLLPVKSINISYFKKANGVQINWQSVNEINISEFQLEKSSDGVSNWNTINTITALNRNLSNYTFLDVQTGSIFFYRIKGIENNGSYFYSTIQKVVNNNIADNNIKIFPSIANNTITVTLSNFPYTKSTLDIYDLSGRFVKSVTNNNLSINVIDISTLKSGIYLLKTTENFYNSQTQKFIKQ